MKRLIIIIAAGVAALGLTGTSALAGGPIEGAAAGRENAAPNASATCNPFAATQPSDYLCRYQVHGSYFDDNSILGDGTYTGTITQDYNTIGATGNANHNNEQCLSVSGTITYKRTGKTGVLTTTLVAIPVPFDPINGLYSMTCIPPAGGYGSDFHYKQDVTGATGYFHSAVKDPTGDYIIVNGYEYPSGGNHQNYTVEASLGVSVS